MSDASNRWILKAPRRSALNRAQRAAVFAGLCALAAAFALFVWLMFDAWAVIPFTGVELAAVGVAFWWWERHSDDFEAIIVHEGNVQVLRRYGAKSEQVELPGAWAQVSREAQPSGWGKRRRLVIACKGTAVTFGEFLNEAGVNECQRLLRERLKAAWI